LTKNPQIFQNIRKIAILEKNKIFENFWIENFDIFRTLNCKFWLIYTFFNYGNTWKRLLGPFYPIYKLLAHYFYLCQKTSRTTDSLYICYKLFVLGTKILGYIVAQSYTECFFLLSFKKINLVDAFSIFNMFIQSMTPNCHIFLFSYSPFGYSIFWVNVPKLSPFFEVFFKVWQFGVMDCNINLKKRLPDFFQWKHSV